MQGGGSIVQLARKAAALARTGRAARLAAMRPVWKRNYRGVQQRKNRYYSVIRNIHTRRLVWLGSYKAPDEAAYAWDAAARVTHGHWAKPKFPEPTWARAAPAREEVSTELVLALPMPAACEPAVPARRREPAAAVAAQPLRRPSTTGCCLRRRPQQSHSNSREHRRWCCRTSNNARGYCHRSHSFSTFQVPPLLQPPPMAAPLSSILPSPTRAPVF